MDNVFSSLVEGLVFTGVLEKDSNNLLIKHKRFRIAEHSLRVAKKCKALAKYFGYDENLAEIAGLLHDIGGIYAYEKRVDISKKLKIEILPEEEKLPLILHQKISMVMANEIFNVQSKEVLNAIGCHTTLKARSTCLDKILFVADKIEWDQDGLPPYIEEIEKAEKVSLELAAFKYIEYLFNDSSKLKVIHPWMVEAYYELKNELDLKFLLP